MAEPALVLGAGLAAALYGRRCAPHATLALSGEQEERLATLWERRWGKLIEVLRRSDPVMRRFCASHEENRVIKRTRRPEIIEQDCSRNTPIREWCR